jgi:pantoate--beta-alanine ligase
MIIFKHPKDLQSYIQNGAIDPNSIGFVPTMGALHKGHISLIQTARVENSLVVASIFVNPTQFTDQLDFEKYPSTIESDILKLEHSGCDILFLPSVADIYPNGITANQQYNLGHLDTILEGKYRPGHFQGVCQIVHLLLQIISPGKLYLGQKDYQQCLVIKKMISLLHIGTSVIICPTQREPDGLAMSSRNVRLTSIEREKATYIFKMLNYINENSKAEDLEKLEQIVQNKLTEQGFKVEYVAIADQLTLENIQFRDKPSTPVALIAAYINQVRLIDNLILN